MRSIRKLINYHTAALMFFAVLLILVLTTFRDYGIAWDESFHVTYGQAIVDYYRAWLNGSADLTAVSYRNLYLYGGAYDLFATLTTGLLQQITAFGKMELHHLVNALTGILGVIGAWAVVRLLAGERAAFWTAVLLAFTPLYYGHMFFNPKDIPFAVGYIWSLYFLARILRDFPRVKWSNLAWFGLAAGITLGIRIGGVFLFGYFGLALLWNFCVERRSGNPAGWKSFLRLVALPVAFSGLIAYFVMLAGWPYAQQNPLRYPLQALVQMRQFDWPYGVLYRGEIISAVFLPGEYLIHYLAITLPELVIFLLAAGALLAVIGWRRGTSQSGGGVPTLLASGSLLLVIATLVPVATAIIGRSTLYDGIRHLLFIIPPLACLGGIGLHLLQEFLSTRSSKAAAGAALLFGVLLVYQGSVMAHLHPYEYIYLNGLVGGVTQAYRAYETDYWGTAASEAAKWLVQTLQEQGWSGGEPVKVYVAGANDFSARYYFPDWIEFTPLPEEADYFIGGIRSFSMDDLPGVERFAVIRLGVPLAVVKELDN